MARGSLTAPKELAKLRWYDAQLFNILLSYCGAMDAGAWTKAGRADNGARLLTLVLLVAASPVRIHCR